METILVKILAVVLALSQIGTRPDEVKTHFDNTADRGEVVGLLRAGCAHVRKVFEVEDLQLDDLIATALADPQSITGEIKAFRGINFDDLHAIYRQLCTNHQVESTAVDFGQVIDFYNKAAADLPDHTRLKGLKLPSPSTVLDSKGDYFSELYEPGNRRIPIPLKEIPEVVQRAFVAAEDKRFFQHKGIDERGMVRAFVFNVVQPGRPQGGSTITQQVVKNLLVGDDVTYERKIREIVVTSRLERTLTKAEILELYLNSIYFGRNSWGLEMAARAYFGRSAKELNAPEGALLAGLVKGPNYFSPDRHPDRARERLDYVLGRMQEDGAITADQMKQMRGVLPHVITDQKPRYVAGQYFFDHLAREVKTLPRIEPLTTATYTVHSTILPDLQKAAEAALQEGLAQYELNTRRVDFQGPEANLSEAIRKVQDGRDSSQMYNPDQTKPDWQQALEKIRLPLYDVHWLPAVVVEKPRAKKSGGTLRVGLADGRILPLKTGSSDIERRLQINDVIYVRVVEGKGKTARANLRVRPVVQGAALVLENKTGRILAMAGGFSYPLSQLNRTVQARRQPGSALKPLTYLAALRNGLQPNTLVRDEPITLPPIGGGAHAREKDYWTPKNYDGTASGIITLRRALENSRNLATVGLLDGGIDDSPERSLDRICELAQEAQLYAECLRFYPIVLGAQPVRLLDLAAFYAAIANEGARPNPHTIETIRQDGRIVYRDDTTSATWVGSADRVAFFQLKSMLQGVLQRGTARAIQHLSPYVAGKTGTSDDENDAWFIGFTNDVTVAVWVGYDNNNGRRTLGSGQTGGKVAVPIFEPIVKAAWSSYSRQAVLSPPSPDARRQLVSLPIDVHTGDRFAERSERAFYEHFRLDPYGRLTDTRHRLVTREETFRDPILRDDQDMFGRDIRPFAQRPWYRVLPEPLPPPLFRGLFGDQRYWQDDEFERRRQRRFDPDYFWNNRRFN